MRYRLLCRHLLGFRRFCTATTNITTIDCRHNPLLKLRSHASGGLRLFLEKITSKPKEARMWLKYFKDFSASSQGKVFAILKLDSEVLESYETLDKLAWSVSFLNDNRLFPLLVCETRANSPMWLLQQAFRQLNTPSQLFSNSEFLVDDLVNADKSVVPIVAVDDHLGESIDDVTIKLCAALRPLKVMLLSNQSGICTTTGVLSDVLLPGDFEHLMNSLGSTDQKNVNLASLLLKQLTCESSVVLTRADTVIQELFTHQGTGTMFRLSEKIFKYNNLDSIDSARLSRLINQAFQKPLKQCYIDRVRPILDAVYVSERYNAAAVITSVPGQSVPYMDKIAVSLAAQGNGISAVLWNEIVKDYSQLFWRTTITNSTALSWYFTVSQGSWKTQSDWTVFWYGLDNSHQLGNLIDYAENKDADFHAPANIELLPVSSVKMYN